MTSPDRTAAKVKVLAAAAGGPVYEADPEHEGLVVQVTTDGARTSGVVKNGKFVPIPIESLRLSERDRKAFISSLLSPPNPPGRLKRAAKRYREQAGSQIGPAAVADILGIKAGSWLELHDRIIHGLPKATLRRCAAWFSDDPSVQTMVINQIMPPVAYRRCKALTLVQGDMVVRLARVIATAAYVWNNKADAQKFLIVPHKMLRMKTAVEMARTDLGARLVEEILWSIVYGLPAGPPAKTSKDLCAEWKAVQEYWTTKDRAKGIRKESDLRQGKRDRARYEQLLELSLQVIRDRKTAEAWFSRPNPALRGATPLECIRTAQGARAVKRILQELYAGVFT